MGYSKSSSKKEVDSNTILPQETRKTSNTQLNNWKNKNIKISRRKEIIKIRAEIN